MIPPMQFEIRFRPSGRSVRVAAGTTLLEAARAAGLPAARACGGEILCGRCTCMLLGEAAAPAESEDERRAKARNRVDPDKRLACAVRIERDLEASAPGW
jgi:ferredoxin